MLYQVKTSGHAEDRRKERTPHVNSDTLSTITQQVKRLGLDSGVYHVPVRKNGTVQGYAVYRRRGARSIGLVTVYGKDMRPPGPNLETSLKTAGLGDSNSAFEQTPYVPYDAPKPAESDPTHMVGSDRSPDDFFNYIWNASIDDGRNPATMNANQESSIGPGYIKSAAIKNARQLYGV